MSNVRQLKKGGSALRGSCEQAGERPGRGGLLARSKTSPLRAASLAARSSPPPGLSPARSHGNRQCRATFSNVVLQIARPRVAARCSRCRPAAFERFGSGFRRGDAESDCSEAGWDQGQWSSAWILRAGREEGRAEARTAQRAMLPAGSMPSIERGGRLGPIFLPPCPHEPRSAELPFVQRQAFLGDPHFSRNARNEKLGSTRFSSRAAR